MTSPLTGTASSPALYQPTEAEAAPLPRSATSPAPLNSVVPGSSAALPSTLETEQDSLATDTLRPGFLYSATHKGQARPASYASFSSLSNKGGRVQLGGEMRYQQHDALQLEREQLGAQHEQQETLEDDAAGNPNGNPYAWERPLDAVNRHSRMLDFAPVPASPAESTRRLSRIPSAGMLDPFGFSTSSEPSPYDTALAYSTNPATRQRASFLGPPPVSSSGGAGSLGSASPYPSTSSMLSVASGSSFPTTSTAGTSWASNGDANGGAGVGGQQGQPWLKQRSVSMGESSASRQQIRGSMMVQRPGNRSKLSGEINADTQSLAEIPMSSPDVIPKEADYTNSKLYQRTLKAQKALEKERAKAAAKGKISKFDQPATTGTTTKSERRQSSASSFMSDMPLPGRRSRSSLGWFRSSSEATLPIPPGPSFTPPLPTSRSVSQLPLPTTPRQPTPPSPNLSQQQQQQQQQQRLAAGGSNDRLRAYRASVGAPSPPLVQPRSVSPGDPRRQRQHSHEAPPSRGSRTPPASHPPSASRTGSHNSETMADRPSRQSSLVAPSAIPLSPDLSGSSFTSTAAPPPPTGAERPRISPRSTLDVEPSPHPSRTPSPLAASEPLPPRTDSIYLSSKEPSFEQERSSRDGSRSTTNGGRGPSPSPPSSDDSPVTPRSGSRTGLGLGVPTVGGGHDGPSFPPGAAPSQWTEDGRPQPRKRKSSLNMLLGALGGGAGKKEEGEQSRASTTTPVAAPAPSKHASPAPAPPAPTTTPKKLARASFFSRSSKEPSTASASIPRPPPQAQSRPSTAPAPYDTYPARSPALASSTNTAHSSTSKLGKSKSSSSSSGGGFFSFGRSRSKTNEEEKRRGGNGKGDKELPPMPMASSPVLGRGQQPQQPVKAKARSRWGGGGGADGYHPQPPPAYA